MNMLIFIIMFLRINHWQQHCLDTCGFITYAAWSTFRAFEPYVTTKARGTGLGLAVVKKIADEHGARIDLGNRDDGGVIQGAQVSLSFAPERTG
jgi:light-regulated signal transduction histidine kinase (bacteriophytochrome)